LRLVIYGSGVTDSRFVSFHMHTISQGRIIPYPCQRFMLEYLLMLPTLPLSGFSPEAKMAAFPADTSLKYLATWTLVGCVYPDVKRTPSNKRPSQITTKYGQLWLECSQPNYHWALILSSRLSSSSQMLSDSIKLTAKDSNMKSKLSHRTIIPKTKTGTHSFKLGTRTIVTVRTGCLPAIRVWFYLWRLVRSKGWLHDHTVC